MNPNKLDNSRAWLDNMPPSIHSTRKTALIFEEDLQRLTRLPWVVTVDTSLKGLGGLRVAPTEDRMVEVGPALRIGRADWRRLKRIFLAVPNREAEFWYIFPDEIGMCMEKMAKLLKRKLRTDSPSNEIKDRRSAA